MGSRTPSRLAVTLACACFVAPPRARAQRGDARCERDADLCSGDVVVTASRTESAADDSPVRVEVIDRAQIERSGARDLGELMEEQPGVLVSRTFRGDEIQMQGLDPEYVLVLVDGDRVPGRIGGAIDLGRYSLEDVERVEIVRGASSALYGSDALGGVINIVTRRAREDFEADAAAMAGGGAGAVVDATARAAGRIGDVSLRVSGGFHYAEPFRRAWSGDASTPEQDRPTSGSARTQWSLGGQVSWRVDESVALDARVEYLQRQLSGVDRNAAGAIFDRVQLAEQLQASATATVRLRGAGRITTRGTYSLFREQYLYDQRGSSALDDVQDNREDLGQLTLQYDQPEGDHLVTVGLEEIFQRLESARLEAPGMRFRFAPFVQDTWYLVDERDLTLVVVPGLRLDADSQFGTQLSPKLSVRFDPIPNRLVLRASYGSGFRAPSFQELLLRFENPSVGYVVQGNPELQAETSRSFQGGVEWRPMPELRMSASYFRNDIDGLITTVTAEETTAGTLFTYANIASAYTQGLESQLVARPIRELTLTASYTLTDTWDEDAQRPIEGRAMHRVTLAATFDHAEWELGGTARCALTGERPFYADGDGDGMEETTYAPWAAQLDLRIWKRITRHFEASVGVDNVLDAGDAFLALRPRTFYGGLRGRY
jgi:outer membrane receptor for ferrienterochelin and colicins